ncbi:MAG: hypothetical protein CAF43_007570 [Nitrospira sp. CG24C]|nr:MAG: hypothetical protein CAF43_007570 [Nitrospira sp. CG24C]
MSRKPTSSFSRRIWRSANRRASRVFSACPAVPTGRTNYFFATICCRSTCSRSWIRSWACESTTVIAAAISSLACGL